MAILFGCLATTGVNTPLITNRTTVARYSDNSIHEICRRTVVLAKVHTHALRVDVVAKPTKKPTKLLT